MIYKISIKVIAESYYPCCRKKEYTAVEENFSKNTIKFISLF